MKYLFALTSFLLTVCSVAQERLNKLELNILTQPKGEAALVISAPSHDPLNFASSMQNSFNGLGFFLPIAGVGPNPKPEVIAKYRGSEMLLLTSTYRQRMDTGCDGAVPSKLSGQVLYFGSENEPSVCANFSFSQSGLEGKCMYRVTNDLALRLIAEFNLSRDLQLNGHISNIGNRDIDEESLKAAVTRNPKNDIEGVYKSMIGGNSRCGSYRVGIISNESGFDIVNLSDNGNWKVGNIKGELEPTAVPKIYSGTWRGLNKNPFDCMANLDGGVLDIIWSEEMTCTYVKLWPRAVADVPLSTESQIIATGSAVVVDAQNGLCVTNAHVLDDNFQSFVKVNGQEFKCQTVQVDENNDLALLKILDTEELSLVGVPISMSPSVGLKVYSAGYPKMSVMGESLKVTEGIISSQSFLNDPSKFQISCPITNGNSGGALLDEFGNLVGITQGGYRPDMTTENVNAAVKSLFIVNIASVSSSAKLDMTMSTRPIDFSHIEKAVLPVLIKN